MNDDEYTAQASTIEIEDITPNARNQTILRLLNQNDPSLTKLYAGHQDSGTGSHSYVPDGADDLGWLGYSIANNTKLEEIALYCNGSLNSLPLGSFFNWVLRNKSLSRVSFMGLEGGQEFPTRNHCFQINRNLTDIRMKRCDLRAEAHGLISLAIGPAAPMLEHLSLIYCSIGHREVKELTHGLSSCRLLRNLCLCNTGIGDAGVKALAPVLAHSSQLKTLNLNQNSITARGCRDISNVLQGSNSSLEAVSVEWNSIGDEGALIFSNALVGNCKLTTLFCSRNGITAEAWPAFSTLLCDTSSVNRTFLSNHTLIEIHPDHETPNDVESLLTLNRGTDKKRVAMIKILEHHSVFNVQPFFEWDLKVLPHAIDWLERASACAADFDANIEQRKLTTIYQFLRGMAGMSDEYTDSLLRHESFVIQAQEMELEGELHDVESGMQEPECELSGVKRRKRSIL